MRSVPLALVALVALAGLAPAQLDAEVLQKITAEIRPHVEKATGTKLDGVEVRLGTRRELAKILASEIRTFASSQQSEAQARVFGRSASRLLLAKYVLDEDAIVVNARNIRAQARLRKKPILDSTAVYRPLLIHEFVHAADQRSHDWTEVARRLKDPIQFGAYMAVVEGNAQRITAAICKEQG